MGSDYSITILKYTKSSEQGKGENKEIFQYISDKRILRVLFEQKIFTLREIQKEAIKKGLFFRNSFLVCAPSGSGKTLIGEVCAVNNIFERFGKSVYLVPFKALATEKYFHFKRSYERFGIIVELSIGDYDIDDSKLQNADIIVTTFEKMDSLLRNFYDKEWIMTISTIIIDEIHSVGEGDRGPRLESLIVRLNELLHNPQIIGLSATIANPSFFNKWLSSLGNNTNLINSNIRPVDLHYKVEITQNKDSTIKKIVNSILKDDGQLLIFLNTRKSTQQAAKNLKVFIKNHTTEKQLELCKELEANLKRIKGGNAELQKVVKCGIAFHHAGLLPKERISIENAYRRRIIKVIFTTSTLSAGINMPARAVIIKDFRRYVTSGHNIKNFTGYYENGNGFSFFKPFSANEVFQMLGRAGRPGLDEVGYGILLVNDVEERNWVEDHYFIYSKVSKRYLPRYNDLQSGLNKMNILQEQVLLRVYQEKHISLEALIDFFQKTYFWFSTQERMKEQSIPIEQLLMIKEISPKNILKLHSEPSKIKEIKNKNFEIKIAKLTNSIISGYLKTAYGVYICELGIDTGIRCSCGFENGISDNYANDRFAFEFCDHITAFLLYLNALPDEKLQKYITDIIPKSVRNQYVLNYLLEKGLLIKSEDGLLKCSQFGKLIIRLYLYPVSGVLIRQKLEQNQIETFQEIIKEAYDILKAEHRVRDNKVLQPILEWTDEEPIEEIIKRHKLMAGDLYSVRDNLERIISFIGIIAIHLSETDFSIQNNLIEIAEMCETLKIRIHYGIREELFDLVLRLPNVARVRARIIYKAGYRTATQVKKENPFVLHRKTGLGLKLCKTIIKDTK